MKQEGGQGECKRAQRFVFTTRGAGFAAFVCILGLPDPECAFFDSIVADFGGIIRPVMMEASTSNGGAVENGEVSMQASAAVELEEAQRLYDDGCEFSRNEAFDDAAECFSKALEIR